MTDMLERIGTQAVQLAERGRRLKVAHLNPADFWTEVRELAAKVVTGSPYRDGVMELVTLHTPAGDVDVYSDADVMPGTIFCPREANEP